jgi:hypothetical protein
MKKRILIIFFIFLLAGCGKKHQEPELSTSDNFIVMSPWYSLDDKYRMQVNKNHVVIISDANKKLSDSETIINGKWSVDEAKKSVSITLNDKTDSYLYIDPNNDSASILVNGSLENANLTQSWFSVFHEDDSQETESGP